MDLISHALVAVVCLAAGAAGYRYFLKRYPERLEALARKIKEAGQ